MCVWDLTEKTEKESVKDQRHRRSAVPWKPREENVSEKRELSTV